MNSRPFGIRCTTENQNDIKIGAKLGRMPDVDLFQGVECCGYGILTADVTKGLPARLCSIDSAADHQHIIAPIA